MFSDVAVNQHVRLHLRLLSKLLLADIADQEAAWRQEMRLPMLQHVLGGLETSIAKIASCCFTRIVNFSMTDQRLSSVETLRTFKWSAKGKAVSLSISPSNKLHRRTKELAHDDWRGEFARRQRWWNVCGILSTGSCVFLQMGRCEWSRVFQASCVRRSFYHTLKRINYLWNSQWLRFDDLRVQMNDCLCWPCVLSKWFCNPFRVL